MLKIDKTQTYGWDAAIRGMRNPKNSWNRMDSTVEVIFDESTAGNVILGHANTIILTKNKVDFN